MSIYVFHINACHLCRFIAFTSIHLFHVYSCHSWQFMSLMAIHVIHAIHINSWHSCHWSLNSSENSVKQGRAENRGEICLARLSAAASPSGRRQKWHDYNVYLFTSFWNLSETALIIGSFTWVVSAANESVLLLLLRRQAIPVTLSRKALPGLWGELRLIHYIGILICNDFILHC